MPRDKNVKREWLLKTPFPFIYDDPVSSIILAYTAENIQTILTAPFEVVIFEVVIKATFGIIFIKLVLYCL